MAVTDACKCGSPTCRLKAAVAEATRTEAQFADEWTRVKRRLERVSERWDAAAEGRREAERALQAHLERQAQAA